MVFVMLGGGDIWCGAGLLTRRDSSSDGLGGMVRREKNQSQHEGDGAF